MRKKESCRYVVGIDSESAIVLSAVFGGASAILFVMFVAGFDLEDGLRIAVLDALGIVFSGGIGLMTIMSANTKIKVYREKCILVSIFFRKEYKFVDFGRPKSKVKTIRMDTHDDKITIYTFYNKKGRRLFQINKQMKNATRLYNEIMSYAR